jgi:hypothetical protein
MASFTITGNVTTAQLLQGGDTGLITASGALTTSAAAVTIQHASTTNLSSLIVLGTLISTFDQAIESSGTNGSVRITVGASGSIISQVASAGAITLTAADRVSINNAGLI